MDETKVIDWYEKAIAWYEQIEKTAEFYQNFGEEYEAAQAALEALREKLNRCKDGGINGPTMALIEREALIKRIREEPTDGMFTEEIVGAILEQPTIDAAPVVHGRWVFNAGVEYRYECSKCGYPAPFMYPGQSRTDYCPSCGARMDGGGEHGAN